MPTVRANDIDLYYEEHGSGEPLLLIMGWGGNAASWEPQLAGLAENFRVIIFDNRGAGRSSAPDEPYSIVQMATDTARLMEALELPRAHVFGISMGGMIAQELALMHPEKVGALVLGCSAHSLDRRKYIGNACLGSIDGSRHRPNCSVVELLVIGHVLPPPSGQNKGVVDGQTHDLVDAFRPEGACGLNEARQVLGRTGARERARHAKQRHPLAVE